MTLKWVTGWNGLTEPEAVSYVAAVEAADGEPLEFGVAKAINDFVLGCKNDGIWSAIKACCILAGARTLSGALVPLVGTAPTNYNFVAGDYNRETGLIGDGSTKYLDSNRNNNADPQNSKHVSVYATVAGVGAVNYFPTYMGVGRQSNGSTNFGINASSGFLYCRHNTFIFNTTNSANSTGLIGLNRNQSALYDFKTSASFATVTTASQTPFNGNLFVFGDNVTPFQTDTISNARIAFYSIGESLNLAKLDTRVTRLMNLITYTQTAGLPDLSVMDMDAAAYIGGAYRAGGTLS